MPNLYKKRSIATGRCMSCLTGTKKIPSYESLSEVEKWDSETTISKVD